MPEHFQSVALACFSRGVPVVVVDVIVIVARYALVCIYILSDVIIVCLGTHSCVVYKYTVLGSIRTDRRVYDGYCKITTTTTPTTTTTTPTRRRRWLCVCTRTVQCGFRKSAERAWEKLGNTQAHGALAARDQSDAHIAWTKREIHAPSRSGKVRANGERVWRQY